VAYKPTENNLQ